MGKFIGGLGTVGQGSGIQVKWEVWQSLLYLTSRPPEMRPRTVPTPWKVSDSPSVFVHASRTRLSGHCTNGRELVISCL